MNEFIAVKGVTARGKRITTFEVKRFEDITPEIELAEHEEDLLTEPIEAANLALDSSVTKTEKSSKDAESEKIDDGVAFTIEATIPDDSKPVASEPDGQMSLF